MSLEAADRVEIADLCARYGYLFDAGDGAGCAALFAPDASFEAREGSVLSGAAAISEFVSSTHAALRSRVRHFPTAPVLDDIGDAVQGHSNVFALRLDDEGSLRLVTIAEYQDTYAKVGTAWKIRTRTIRRWLPAELSDSVLVGARASVGSA
jgi:hypothetical protein